MKPLLKNLLVALGLVFIAGLGYFILMGSDSDDVLVSSTGGVESRAALEAQEFLGKLRLLQTLDVKGDIFADPRFASLVDFREPIEDEPTGRVNPFAPLE